MTDKQIAQGVLDIVKKHRESWNGQIYALGNFTALVREWLDDKDSAFARCLHTFANWSNDIIDICEMEVSRK